MISRDELTKFVYKTIGHDLLKQAASTDTIPNSVQIHGTDEVERVILGVSASPEFIEQAVNESANYLIVHHGLHTKDMVNGRFDPFEHRLSLIFKHDITLAGFHYSLDAHPAIGNNAIIIKELGAKKLDIPYFDGWGWVGEFSKPQDVGKLASMCSKLFEHDVFAVYSGPKMIKRIGVCSGGATPWGNDMFEIIDKNIDLHITGEIRESSPYYAEELKYNYFSCGHYATEVFGVQALAGKIKKKFGSQVEVEFIDIPTLL